MERSGHSLVPQWLKSSGSFSGVPSTSSSYSEHITYSGHQSSSKGSSLSRSYSTFEKSSHDRDLEKDTGKSNSFGKDKLFPGEGNHDYSDCVPNILSNRFEKDQLQHSQSMNSVRWTLRTSGDESNPQRNRRKCDGLVTGDVGIMHKTLLDVEFPILGAEVKHGSSESGRLSSSSVTSSPSLLTGTSAATVSNGLTLASSHGIPMTVGSSNTAIMMHHHNVSRSISSIALGASGLSMAETLAQGPPRPHTLPQLSVRTQKLEELAFKQSRLLIPMTPSTPRSLVASPSEKSKIKTGQQQYTFPYSRRPSQPLHGALPNSDLQKISSGNSVNVSASRELNGVPTAAKDNLSPSRSRVVLGPVGATTSTSLSAPSRSSSNNSTPSSWITLEKRPTFPTQSRNDFFKNLSRKSSSKTPRSDVYPIDMSCTLESLEASSRNVTRCLIPKSRDSHSMDTSAAMNMLTEYSSISNGNSFSSNGEQQHSTKPVPYLDEEEIAFLRSLGWEESTGDDEGLTEEEIQDFYEKYMKLQQQ
ncbi:hypothetical protein RJT34_04075 [Clitoria ternatea]|uniref:Uncharacterized protein n=1 Tax=Clitoria ternatea TaxID=43366 RepID=A0AAN9Q0A5_CLITE